MLNKLEGYLLGSVDHGGMLTNWYYAVLAPNHVFEDLFKPHFWDHHKSKLNVGDIIRTRAHNGDFDIMLVVSDKLDNGEINVELWPKFPARFTSDQIASISAVGAASEHIKPTIVPLSEVDGEPKARIEWLEATQWRCRGVSGDEISRNHKSASDAQRYLDNYCKRMNLILPSEDEIKAKKEEIAEKRVKMLEDAATRAGIKKAKANV